MPEPGGGHRLHTLQVFTVSGGRVARNVVFADPRLPELRRYTVSRGVAAVRGTPDYLVAELEWDTMDELRAAFASPQGRATAEDAARLQELAPVRSIIFTADDSMIDLRPE
jgi:uncharacterized protein (TIGR02118 family)